MECSVVLSAYCGEKYLRAQLDSILNQSRSPDEIIVIDDCSPDNGVTERIIDEYAGNYPSIKKYCNPKNMGWAASFMNGIKYATKDVVFFSDQDDIWDSEKIQSMMSIMEKEKLNVLISDWQNVDENLKPLQQKQWTELLVSDRFQFGKNFIKPKGVGAAMAIRKDFMDKYYELWNPLVGHDHFYQIITVCFDTLYYLDKPLIYHRFHESNATGVARRSFDASNRIESTKGLVQLVSDIQKSSFSKELDEDKNKILRGYIKFGNARIEMLKKKSVLKWVCMAAYGLAYYPTKNTWMGDLLSIVKG